VLIVAAGALESARLLLLSRDDPRWPDGVGNTAGQVGAGLAFHHVWSGRMRYDEALYPGRIGGWTAQSLQFANPETRGQHGGVRVEFSSRLAYEPPQTWATVADLRAAMGPHLQWRQIVLQAESAFSAERRLMLSGEIDRYGDPLAHVVYRLDDWDHATYDYARGVFDQFVAHTRPAQSEFPPFDWYNSGSHHMGGVRMGGGPDEGVIDSFGEVFGVPGILVVGGGSFVGSSGAANPTLTIAALALRSVDYLIDQRLSGV
jgi:choline dehydrogenase-like flavoprotein